MEGVKSEKNLSIKEADRMVFRASFDIGLVDIFISSVVLMFAEAPFLSVYLGDFWSSAIFLPFWGAVFLILLWIRNNVIKPRSGLINYGPLRRKKWTNIIPFSVMVLISFSLAGYFLDVTRFFLYGFMLSGGFFVGEWLYQAYGVAHHEYPMVFGISAGVIFLTGLFKLITFVQENPLPTDDQMQWEGKNG